MCTQTHEQHKLHVYVHTCIKLVHQIPLAIWNCPLVSITMLLIYHHLELRGGEWWKWGEVPPYMVNQYVWVGLLLDLGLDLLLHGSLSFSLDLLYLDLLFFFHICFFSGRPLLIGPSLISLLISISPLGPTSHWANSSILWVHPSWLRQSQLESPWHALE